MLILLMLALAAPDGSAKTAPPALQIRGVTLTAPQREWFQERAKPFGASVRLAQDAPSNVPLISARESGDPTEMTCTIRILKADPGFDAGIVKQAPPGLDPKIVRLSRCRK